MVSPPPSSPPSTGAEAMRWKKRVGLPNYVDQI
jgi:hypothetical protein